MGTDVEVAAQDDPETGDEHCVLAGDDLAQHTGGQGADDTAELENGCQPARR